MSRADPTNTTSIRRSYAQALRGRYDEIEEVMVEAISEDLVLGELTAEISHPRDISHLSEPERARRMADWFRDAQESEVLEVIGPDENRFIARSYERGLDDADMRMRRIGLDIDEQDVGGIIRQPVHERTLEEIFARNYEDLQGITEETATQIQKNLIDGLAQGKNPNDIARDMSNRIGSIGRTRATVLARTEVISAYSEASLNRYEEFDQVEGVVVQAEWQTAGDDRVCPVCEDVEALGPKTLETVRNASHKFEPGADDPSHLAGEFPMQPPLHPQCRCALIPVSSTTASIARRNPAGYCEMYRTNQLVAA